MDSYKKLSLSIPTEMHPRLLLLKQRMFYDATWSELYRYVLEVGLDALIAGDTKDSKESGA